MRSDLVFFLFGVFLLGGCEQSATSGKTETPDALPIVEAPFFNADSAYHFIQKQIEFGPRVPNSKAHDSCASYLRSRLSSHTGHLVTQEFESRNQSTGEYYRFQNIIASFNPTVGRRILLAAHWDTRGKADKDKDDPEQLFDGANDGGSGVAVLLEVARLLEETPIEIGIDIILFDAEDQGGLGLDWCLGSKHWTANKHQAGYAAYYGILLDMVGAKDATFPQEYYSRQYAPSILKKFWDQAHSMGFSRYFLYQDGGAIEDDHYYVNVNARIPMIDVIDMSTNANPQGDFFKSYHHRPSDNMGIIDKNTLNAVGTTLVNLLYSESAALVQ